MTDAMLIQEYVRSRSQEALGKIVARHMDWVYSAALRMVADGDLAQDVTQAVFLVLVQKAAQLQGRPVNAWLFGVTRFAARHALRARERRRRHERRAAIMIGKTATTKDGQDTNQSAWAAIAPLLDEMVGRLGAADRRAVLLRFYQGKSMAELGGLLGVSEDAAKKRVYKAVKRLRELLASRGVRVPADALGVVLLDRATQSAPAKLAELCRKPSVQVTSGAASIANGVIRMMALTKLRIAALTVVGVGVVPSAVALALLAAPATVPDVPVPTASPVADVQGPAAGGDAVDLYARAAKSLTVDSPQATSLVFPEFPPSSPQWQAVEAAAWQADAGARDLVHQASSIATVNWPAPGAANLSYYNQLRNLANHMGDSAVYADIKGNDADAVKIIRDLIHLSDLLKHSAHQQPLPMLVGVGIKALALYDLDMITSGIILTGDSKNTRDLQVADARELISDLLDEPDVTKDYLRAMDAAYSTQPQNMAPNRERATETLKRASADQTMAAMSLACHVFKFETGRWPQTLDELVPTYLPHAVIDPWGDGKQTYGYVLVKGALPDGSDRPLVYDRYNSSDGLHYLTNHIEFAFYVTDGSTRSMQQQKHYGQFRDVTRWEPVKDFNGPTALPIPDQTGTGAGQNIIVPNAPE
ncbi:MAG: sigma-70 family RNA polymerase sigma factor [Tepidisphaeraceae bacterium]|jgi:RNA polymerase sigma factor (sigma-70 family)